VHTLSKTSWHCSSPSAYNAAIYGGALYTGDSDVISSCHIYASCFPAMMWGKLWEMFVIVTPLFQQDSDNADIFLNQLISVLFE